MLNNECLESQQQTVIPEEAVDDFSVRNIETLFQWKYQRTLKFGIKNQGEHTSAAMELARPADKHDMSGLKTTIAERIRNIITPNPHPQNNHAWQNVDSNTYDVEHDHIVSATLLPPVHPVRRILAAASVEGFLQNTRHEAPSGCQFLKTLSVGKDQISTRTFMSRSKPAAEMKAFLQLYVGAYKTSHNNIHPAIPSLGCSYYKRSTLLAMTIDSFLIQ